MEKLKKISIILLVLTLGAAGAYYVIASIVTDSYVDDSGITDSWNISTSTPGELTIEDRSCDFFEWNCTASTTCSNHSGDGDYILVARNDAPTTKQWSSGDCNRPQCSIDGMQSSDYFVTDNTVDFTNFPARDYCKSIDARLPTDVELACILNNNTSFGSNFSAGSYWSSREGYQTGAWHYEAYRCFLPGSCNAGDRLMAYNVRCVKGW